MIISETYTTHYNELLKFATNIHSKQESTDLVSESYVFLMDKTTKQLKQYLTRRSPEKIIKSAIYILSKRLIYKQSKVYLTNDLNHVIDEQPEDNPILEIYDQLNKKEKKLCKDIIKRKNISRRSVCYRRKKLKDSLMKKVRQKKITIKLKQNDY